MSETKVMMINDISTKKESHNNKMNNNNQNVSQKHSGPFYISPSLFDNKRLRQKRLRWAKALLAAAGFKQHQLMQRKKTERRKKVLCDLRASVTIDLLSEDEEKSSFQINGDVQYNKTIADTKQSMPFPDGPPPLAPISNMYSTNKLHLSQVYNCSNQTIELSKVPNITLVPVQNLTSTPISQAPVASVAPMPRRVKRKRKSQQPQRHKQPIVVNNESIVLSDDSDNDICLVESPPKNISNTTHSPTYTSVAAVSPITTPIIANSFSLAETTPSSSSKPTTSPALQTPYSAQVEEEVTVSIVPRSSTAGNCLKSSASELFPMLPDETTVHTVIANRTYELSLAKLREGLASCGVSEFANGQQNTASTRRKGQLVDTPPMVSPNPPPISLKLSSDLSISLISDDDEDTAEQQRLAAESLLQKQPQLVVQHLQLPAVGPLPAGANLSLANSRLPSRRQKLS
ncbi:protein a6 [Ceratitis capitata]|uniref:Protein a6 n=1 Tax=Ceratitis capitata TaxID=7213 RepID=W8C759_CERCA|nr:protein a6 [Ceratitis capitata]